MPVLYSATNRLPDLSPARCKGKLDPGAKPVRVPSGAILSMTIPPYIPSCHKATTYKLPPLSKAISSGPIKLPAKMLRLPSQVNLAMLPQSPSSLEFRSAGLYSDTTRFCADALVQIRITAPRHAILLTNQGATPLADLNLVSVSFVFMIVPLACFSSHRGTAENSTRYNANR